MKNFFLPLVVLLFILHSAHAQEKESLPAISFSLGAEASLPVGLFGDVYSFGIGASAQGNFRTSNNTALTLNAGYINYFIKSIYGKGNQGYIPVLGGLEFNFSPKVFGAAQSGFTFFSDGGGSAFTYSPGIGFRISRHFAALLKYVGQVRSAINSSSIGVRGAYIFGK